MSPKLQLIVLLELIVLPELIVLLDRRDSR